METRDSGNSRDSVEPKSEPSNESGTELFNRGIGGSTGSVQTYFVFVDLPRHVEFRSPDLPLLDEGTVVDFDLTIRSLKDPRKTLPVRGRHVVQRSLLKFGGKRAGLVQYLEWRLIK